jgi:hypothetical protein
MRPRCPHCDTPLPCNFYDDPPDVFPCCGKSLGEEPTPEGGDDE